MNHAENLFTKKKYDESLNLVSDIARLEVEKYTGYLNSITLENLLKNMGGEIFPNDTYPKRDENQKKKRVLHISTEIHAIGGHSRVIMDWINNDCESESYLAVTDQPFLDQTSKREIKSKFKGTVVFIEGKSIINRAHKLREYVSSTFFDVIINHQHMNDVVPSIALWDIKNKLNSLSLFYNHANYHFSLGNIIANKRINFCEGDIDISQNYRLPMENVLLPFVFKENDINKANKIEINTFKKKLGIEHQKVFIAIGASYKFKPYKNQNFLSEWNDYLKSKEDAIMLVIGCSKDNFIAHTNNQEISKNLRLLGIVEDLNPYYQISDYIVDIYPLQTGLGTFEGAVKKLAPILPYKENPMVVGNRSFTMYPKQLLKLLKYDDLKSYFEFISEEIKTSAYKISSEIILNKYILENCYYDSWNKHLKKAYVKSSVQNNTVNNERSLLNKTKSSNNWYDYNNSDLYCRDALEIMKAYNVKMNIKVLWTYLKMSMVKNAMFSRLEVLRNFLNITR